jgi:hypothetical protein
VVAKLVDLAWTFIAQAWRLWLVTAFIVLIASVVHYLWSANTRKNVAAKYLRRSPQTAPRLYSEWHSRRD